MPDEKDDGKILEALRSQMAEFQAKVAEMESFKVSGTQERKSHADGIAALKQEIDALKAEMAVRGAPAAPVKESFWDSINPFNWGNDD